MGSLSLHAIHRRILCCRSHCTAANPPTLLLPIHHIARPFTGPSVHSYGTAALTLSAAVRVLLASSIREVFVVLAPPRLELEFR